MKYLKYVYIILVIIMSVGVIFAIGKFEPEIPEGQNLVINSVGEDTSTYQNSSREEVVGETNITDKLKDHWYSGVVTSINGNMIHFSSSYDNKNYCLNVQNSYKFVNLRTGVNIAFEDIKEGDYIDTFSYYMNDVFGVASNITGEVLKQELLQNLALGEANVAGMVASPYIKNIDIVNSNKALMTVEIQDMYGTELGNTEIFEFVFLLNENTSISSKGGGAHSIDTLNNAAHDIVDIYLDKNTLSDKNPLVTTFSSSDS